MLVVPLYLWYGGVVILGNDVKSYKDDKDYQAYLRRKRNKGKILVWLILLGVVAGAGGVGYAILRSNGVGLSSNEGETVSDIPEEYRDRMILKVKSSDSEANTVQFNTIYGGVDYDSELSAYKNKSGNSDIDSVVGYLGNEVDIDSIFDTQQTLLEEAKSLKQGYASDIYLVNRDTPLTLEMLKGDNQLTIELTCVGVVNDYYGVFWLEGTDFYFVSDERNTQLSKDFFYNQMYHIGKDVYFTFNTLDISMEHYDGTDSTIIYMPNYNSLDSESAVTIADGDNTAFDRFAFCPVTSNDYDVLVSFLIDIEKKFNFSMSSLSFDDIDSSRVKTFSARLGDNLKEVMNSSWNTSVSDLTSKTVELYTFKGLGYVCDSNENYVALKYADDVYVVLDISNASRDLVSSHDTNSFVPPFSLLSSNVRVLEDGKNTYILGYFV